MSVSLSALHGKYPCVARWFRHLSRFPALSSAEWIASADMGYGTFFGFIVGGSEVKETKVREVLEMV